MSTVEVAPQVEGQCRALPPQLSARLAEATELLRQNADCGSAVARDWPAVRFVDVDGLRVVYVVAEDRRAVVIVGVHPNDARSADAGESNGVAAPAEDDSGRIRGVFVPPRPCRDASANPLRIPTNPARRWEPSIVITRRMLESDDE